MYTNLHTHNNNNNTYTNIKHKIFEELVPSASPLLKKHIWLGHAGIVDHSVDLSIPDLNKALKKTKGMGMERQRFTHYDFKHAPPQKKKRRNKKYTVIITTGSSFVRTF